jgi:hypothetical protein
LQDGVAHELRTTVRTQGGRSAVRTHQARQHGDELLDRKTSSGHSSAWKMSSSVRSKKVR